MIKLNVKKIRKELKRLHWTQVDLAKEAGVKKQAVWYWLRYKSVRGAGPIAKALSVDPKDLIK